jgi:hypothetical protein
MKVLGACHCGKIAYEAEINPNNIWLCHCTDCQTLTGTAYRAVVQASAESFKLVKGEPKIYIKTADNGVRRVHGFCAECGTPIYGSAVSNPKSYSLRIGAIKQREELRPERQIWCRSALPWAMDLSGIEKADRQ